MSDQPDLSERSLRLLHRMLRYLLDQRPKSGPVPEELHRQIEATYQLIAKLTEEKR